MSMTSGRGFTRVSGTPRVVAQRSDRIINSFRSTEEGRRKHHALILSAYEKSR